MTPKQVMAIDPGTSKTGIVCGSPGKESIPNIRFIFQPAKELSHVEAFTGFLKLYAPDLVVIEDTFMGKFAHSALMLTRYTGHLEAACLLEGIPVTFVPASVWQSYIIPKLGVTIRKDTKKRYCEKAQDFIGHKLPVDVAAAVCIWVYCRDRFLAGEPLLPIRRTRQVMALR